MDEARSGGEVRHAAVGASLGRTEAVLLQPGLIGRPNQHNTPVTSRPSSSAQPAMACRHGGPLNCRLGHPVAQAVVVEPEVPEGAPKPV